MVDYTPEYFALHHWVYKQLGKPDTCENCGESGLPGKKIHWSNKSGEYKKDISDWWRLCLFCHRRYDKVGIIRPRSECPYGHKWVEENIYKRSNGTKECRLCRTSFRRASYLKNPVDREKMNKYHREWYARKKVSNENH